MRSEHMGAPCCSTGRTFFFFFFLNSICGNLRSISYVSSQLDNAPLCKALINRAGDVYRPEQEE